MRCFPLLLIILFCLTACNSKTKIEEINGVEYAVTPVDSSANYLIETESFSGVVFSSHAKLTHDVFTFSMLLRPTKEDKVTPVTPTVNEVVLAEGILEKCVKFDKMGADSLGIKEVDELSSYRRQYFGGLNEKGQKLIWINSFSKASSVGHSDWKTEIVEVDDFGEWYFNVVINVSTGECYRFFRNSIGG